MPGINEGLALSGSFQEFQTQLKVDRESLQKTNLQLLTQSGHVLERLKENDALQKNTATKEHSVEVHNHFYYFLASDPLFDSRTGRCKRPRLE